MEKDPVKDPLVGREVVLLFEFRRVKVTVTMHYPALAALPRVELPIGIVNPNTPQIQVQALREHAR